MARNFFLLIVVVLCALSLVNSRHQRAQLFVAMEREQAIIQAYEIEYDRLRLEQSGFSTQARIDRLARERLGMQFPQAGQIRVLEYNAPLATDKDTP